MKKFLVFFFLMAIVSITASARKSYITVCVPHSNGASNSTYNSSYFIYLTGDVPNGIAGFEYIDSENSVSNEKGHYWRTHTYKNNDLKKYSTGEILNVLSEYGYEVEFVIDNTHFLLSKEIPDGQTISKGDVNTDGEVNIADVNEVISLILGYVREHPNLLEQYAK